MSRAIAFLKHVRNEYRRKRKIDDMLKRIEDRDSIDIFFGV